MGTLTRGGCIRLYDDGPAWHTNDSHVAVEINAAVAPVINSAGDIQFSFTKSRPVIASVAAADETLVQRGITAGISGGVQAVHIRLYRVGTGRLNLNDAAHYAHAAGSTSNLWVDVTSYVPDPVAPPTPPDPEPDPEPEPEPEPLAPPAPSPCGCDGPLTYDDVALLRPRDIRTLRALTDLLSGGLAGIGGGS